MVSALANLITRDITGDDKTSYIRRFYLWRAPRSRDDPATGAARVHPEPSGEDLIQRFHVGAGEDPRDIVKRGTELVFVHSDKCPENPFQYRGGGSDVTASTVVRPNVAGAYLVDCAGGQMGGALRFRNALDSYLAGGRHDVAVIGRGTQVTAGWLLQRESRRRFARVVALNNVSFVTTPGERWVLLRNPLHFLWPAERWRLGRRPPRKIFAQTAIVHTAARRADKIVVPTAGMAERVRSLVPGVASRIVVRPHPLVLSSDHHHDNRESGLFLCPVLLAPWKNMGEVLSVIDRAVAITRASCSAPIRVLVTATSAEAAAAGVTSMNYLEFVGRLGHAELAEVRARCHGTVYPTRIESFGYPLAEARLLRQPVVAADTPQNAEVANDALVPYQRENPEEIADALRRATEVRLGPLTSNPFEPGAYFDWLLGASTR